MSAQPEEIKRRLREILGETEKLQERLKGLSPEQRQKLAEHLKGKMGELGAMQSKLESVGAIISLQNAEAKRPAMSLEKVALFQKLRALPYAEGERLAKFWVQGWLFPVSEKPIPKSLTPSASPRSTPKIAIWALKEFGLATAGPDGHKADPSAWLADLSHQCARSLETYGPTARLSGPEAQEAYLVELVGALADKFGIAPKPDRTPLAFASIFHVNGTEVPDFDEIHIARAVLASIWLRDLASA